MTITADLITDEDVRFFDEHGYWLGPKLFTDAEVDDFRSGHARVSAGEYETGVQPHLRYPVPHDSALVKVDNGWWCDRSLERLVTHPVLGEVAARLLGVEEIRLWHDQVLLKPPSGGDAGVVGYHQDAWYWEVAGTREMVTAWVALDDITLDIGAMHFVDASHRWGLLDSGNFGRTDLQQQRHDLGGGRTWQEVPALLPAGGVSFHHCLTLHGSGANTSERPRRAVAVHLASGAAQVTPPHRHPNLQLVRNRPGERFDGARFPRLWPAD